MPLGPGFHRAKPRRWFSDEVTDAMVWNDVQLCAPTYSAGPGLFGLLVARHRSPAMRDKIKAFRLGVRGIEARGRCGNHEAAAVGFLGRGVIEVTRYRRRREELRARGR